MSRPCQDWPWRQFDNSTHYILLYPLHFVVLAPCFNLDIRPLPWLDLNFGVSRCTCPCSPVPRFLLELTVLIVSNMPVSSRSSLSFYWIGLCSAATESSRAQPEGALPEEHLVLQLWRTLLGGHWGDLVPFLPYWGGTIPWAQRFLVVRETRLLELVSSRMQPTNIVNCFYPVGRP